MSKTRAGRKSWETRVNFNIAIGNFAQAVAVNKWKYSIQETKSMIIERTVKATSKKEVITFAQAYGELSIWLKKSFDNSSELGFSDMLADTFLQKNTVVHSGKAEYRLWVKPE